MTDSDPNGVPDLERVPRAVIRPPKRFGLVWLIPLVAALVGAWLAVKAVTESGPTIHVAFNTAEGLEAGKTKIKYKDVEIGRVESIRLGKDLGRVTVTAKMVKDIEDYLTENTRFWVVRARVAAGQVSGLGTLFSGAYIGMDPGQPGKKANTFVGLETPPAVSMDTPGGYFNLRADRLGSLDIGSPVYYRQIRVGQVVSYQMTDDGSAVDIRIFVNEPHNERVFENTRFWDASGLNVSMGADGVKLNTESVMALLIGGIAYETPDNLNPGGIAGEDHTFVLYSNKDQIDQPQYGLRYYVVAYFDETVRGLKKRAPVEFSGIKVGEVVSVRLEFDQKDLEFRIPVLMAIEPDRIDLKNEVDADSENMISKLIAKGLRAQLRTGSLLTGQLFVHLSMFPDARPQKLAQNGAFPVIPTMPGSTEEITASIAKFASGLEKVPVEQIGRDLSQSLKSINALASSKDLAEAIRALRRSLDQISQFSAGLNRETAPQIHQALGQLNRTLAEAERAMTATEHLVSGSGPLTYELQELMKELAKAAQAISILADYLERHPEALVFGKGDPQP